MTTFVLVILFAGGTAIARPDHDYESCNAAGRAILAAEWPDGDRPQEFLCVPASGASSFVSRIVRRP